MVFSFLKATSVKPDPTAGRETPKTSFRMTKKPRVCHSERSEEFCALIGQIINETSITNKFVTQRNDYRDVTSDKKQ